jgi:hypothetical protein
MLKAHNVRHNSAINDCRRSEEPLQYETSGRPCLFEYNSYNKIILHEVKFVDGSNSIAPRPCRGIDDVSDFFDFTPVAETPTVNCRYFKNRKTLQEVGFLLRFEIAALM